MSNSKSAIQEIKKLMVQFGFMSEEPTLLSFKLQDETILQTEKLEIGNSIYKIDEKFEQVSLENGSYKLKENFEIEVEDGKIKVVKEIFLDAVLKDGTPIKVAGDSLMVGQKVSVMKQEGEIDAPDAVHELEDGTKIETKDGLIVKVEEPSSEADIEDAKEVEVNAGQNYEMEVVELLKDFMNKVNDKMQNFETEIKSIQNEFSSFRKEPAAKKIADGKIEKFNKEDEMDTKINSILNLRKIKK